MRGPTVRPLSPFLTARTHEHLRTSASDYLKVCRDALEVSERFEVALLGADAITDYRTPARPHVGVPPANCSSI